MATSESPRQADSREHTRWNFPVLVMETAVFMSGMAWVDPATVLPLFITRLGGSPLLVGLVTVLQRLGYMLPQLPVASLVGHRPRRAPLLRWGVLIGRLPIMAFVVYLWTLGVANHVFVIGFMLFSYFSTAAGNGVVAVPWQDIIAKSIPSDLRGKFFASMQFTTAVAVVGVGLAVKWMLGPKGPAFPLNYTMLFTLVAVFYTMSTVLCWMLREPIRPVLDSPQSLRAIVQGSIPLLRDHRAFRYLVLTGVLGSSLAFMTPFYTVYARVKLGVPESMAGVYILAMTMTSALFAWVWGQLNDRHGPHMVVRGACVSVALAPTLALVVPLASSGHGHALAYLLVLVFIAAGAATAGMWMGLMNYLFEIASHQDRPRYIALMSFLSTPGAFAPLLIGALLNSLSFRAVFLLLAVCGASAAAVAWRMPPPRPHDGLTD